MKDLNDKVVIVTGAFTGIGKEITKLLIEEGAIVVGNGRNQKNALKLKKEIIKQYFNKKNKKKDKIKKNNKNKNDVENTEIDLEESQDYDISSKFMYHLGDITKEESIKSLVDLTINKYGRIDVLINNAGMIDRFNTIHNMDDDLWEYIINLNLTAPMKLTREVLPYMIEQKQGNIINMGSVGSLYGGRGGVGYVSTKHGLLGLTKNTAQAYGRDGIRSNLIAPSFCLTGIIKPNKEIKIRGFKMVLRGLKTNFKLIDKNDIAKLAIFLASEKSKFINGSSLVIDGGWSAY